MAVIKTQFLLLSWFKKIWLQTTTLLRVFVGKYLTFL